MALFQSLFRTPSHRADTKVRHDTDTTYVPRHCWFTGTSNCLHNHPGDGGYKQPAAHGVWGPA